jgi:2-polyprenyl-6-methoxyphenol hydroxylase-like FAD-dependent oxidoreductase
MQQQNPSTHSGRSLQIGIIGGSIAGCSAAVTLLRSGHQVTVFERSVHKLEDRGAGIVIPTPLFEQLIKQDLIDADTPARALHSMHYRITDDQHSEQGRALWQQPTEGMALAWGELYQQLRKRVPDHCYNSSSEVSVIELAAQHSGLQLHSGENLQFDLLISAEGLQSRARQLVDPNSQLQTASYLLWRGLTRRSAELKPPPEGVVLWHPYPGGLAGSYLIPGKRRSHPDLINWGIYDKLDDQQMQQLFRAQDESSAYAPHRLQGPAIRYLHQLAEQQLPSQSAAIIRHCKAPFLQTISDVQAAQLFRQRLALVGDAAAVLRPHTAGGAVKAIQNSLSLGEALQATVSVDSALASWEQQQLPALQAQARLSKTLGKHWIEQAPDWQQQSERDMNQWWQNMLEGQQWYLNKR